MCHPFRVPTEPFAYCTGVYTPAWRVAPLRGCAQHVGMCIPPPKKKIDYVELTFHNCPRAMPWAI